MTRVTQFTALALGLSVGVLSCSRTDLNTRCVLVRGIPLDGGGATAVPLTEADLIAETGQAADYISRTVACDQAYCVRDQYYIADAGPSEPAYGYCSAPCDPAIGNSCDSADSKLNSGSTKLACRALLLTERTLNAITNPDSGSTGSVGGIYKPYFCARGDAGVTQ